MSDALYTEGEFKIAHWKGFGWDSWIWHRCGKNPEALMWRSCALIKLEKCGWCGIPVPEGLYGLWKLHNWDAIQVIGL